jgi:hypothetical protein
MASYEHALFVPVSLTHMQTRLAHLGQKATLNDELLISVHPSESHQFIQCLLKWCVWRKRFNDGR